MENIHFSLVAVANGVNHIQRRREEKKTNNNRNGVQCEKIMALSNEKTEGHS